MTDFEVARAAVVGDIEPCHNCNYPFSLRAQPISPARLLSNGKMANSHASKGICPFSSMKRMTSGVSAFLQVS